MDNKKLDELINDCLNKIEWLKLKQYWDSRECLMCFEWRLLLRKEDVTYSKKIEIVDIFNRFVFRNYSFLYDIELGIDKLKFLIDTYGFDNNNAEEWLLLLGILNDKNSSIDDKRQALAVVESYDDVVFCYNSKEFLKRNRKKR